LQRNLSANSNSRALVAARLLRADSHSPMESRLYARYCLPRRYGGLNLLPVELNKKLELPERIYRASGISRYSVDLYWPKAHIAIEYEGAGAHSGLSAEERDRLKRNILEVTGVRIISIDKQQYRKEDMLELYGIEIAKAMGIKPWRIKPKANEIAARYALIDAVSNWDADLYRPSSKCN
jgi:very-short-patch-repair endonuclease